MRHRARRLAPLLLTAACALGAPQVALAKSSPSQIEAAKQAALLYLRGQQQPTGAFSGFDSEWVPTALAAAGVAAAEVRTSKTSTDARSYYRALWGDPAWPGEGASASTFEKAVLAAYAAGIDPARVSSSQNLIARVLGYHDPRSPGYYGEAELLNETIFALLALADAKTTKGTPRIPTALLESSVAVLTKNQHTDGGFDYTRAEGDEEALERPGEAETTGAAMAALCSAGVASSSPVIEHATAFLASELEAEASGSGAFATEFGPNTDTNAWAVQGLNACGLEAQSSAFTTAAGKTPIEFLISQQLQGGGFAYEPGEAQANLYSTQDALRALAGAGFTATPPKPKKGPRWEAEKKFARGVAAPLGLIIDGSSGVSACSVTVTPSAAKETLAEVLEAAQHESAPAGCVSSLAPASGKGAITAINGQPTPPAADWEVSIDGARMAQAKRSTPIALGDTIYLKLG